MVYSADLRERDAETAEDAAVSAISEVKFVSSVSVVRHQTVEQAQNAANAAQAAGAFVGNVGIVVSVGNVISYQSPINVDTSIWRRQWHSENAAAMAAAGQMLMCGGVERGFAVGKPLHHPHRYDKRFEGRMGYILEEHFVTLWRGWH